MQPMPFLFPNHSNVACSDWGYPLGPTGTHWDPPSHVIKQAFRNPNHTALGELSVSLNAGGGSEAQLYSTPSFSILLATRAKPCNEMLNTYTNNSTGASTSSFPHSPLSYPLLIEFAINLFQISERMQQRQEPGEVARTNAIMARFRPIAPRPELMEPPRQRSIIAELHLRSRPYRTRRGRSSTSIPPILLKRQRNSTEYIQPCPPPRQLPAELVKPKVMVPMPVRPTPLRPITSHIRIIGNIIEILKPMRTLVTMKPEDVEERIEMDDFPAIISNQKNRARLMNSAYKEMVKQPECVWFDTMGIRQGRRLRSRRINGVVTLGLPENVSLPQNGFSCSVNIEWQNNGKKFIGNVPCEVLKLCCESMNYSFVWRFHINQGTVINMEA